MNGDAIVAIVAAGPRPPPVGVSAALFLCFSRLFRGLLDGFRIKIDRFRRVSAFLFFA